MCFCSFKRRHPKVSNPRRNSWASMLPAYAAPLFFPSCRLRNIKFNSVQITDRKLLLVFHTHHNACFCSNRVGKVGCIKEAYDGSTGVALYSAFWIASSDLILKETNSSDRRYSLTLSILRSTIGRSVDHL